MNERVAIRGVGPVGGFGAGRASLLHALERGGGPNSEMTVTTPEGMKTFPAYRADSSGLANFIDERKLRRVDRFARHALLGVCLALADAGLLEDGDRSRMGLILATGYGALGSATGLLDSILNDGDAFASPLLFTNAIPSAAASLVSILLGIKGPCLTVSQREMSVPLALWSAQQWLLEGRADQVLVGGVDEYCDVVGYCHARFFGEQNRGPIQPLAFDQQTAVVGEGAAFVLLSRDEGGPPRYGYVDRVVLGRAIERPIDLPSNAVVVVGADGHRHGSGQYATLLPAMTHRAGFAPLYGSLPTGLAFDLVIAGMACERGRLWATPRAKGQTSQPPGVGEEVVIGGGPIHCIKSDPDGWFGWIRLCPAASTPVVQPTSK